MDFQIPWIFDRFTLFLWQVIFPVVLGYIAGFSLSRLFFWVLHLSYGFCCFFVLLGFLQIPHVSLGQCYVLGYYVIEGTDEIYRRYISVNYGTITTRYNKLIILILTFTYALSYI